MIHDLKILPEFYVPVVTGIKTFEIRKDDRCFEVGDFIKLREWTEGEGYSGNSVEGVITYITNYNQAEGYVVFSFEITKREFNINY